MFKPYDQKSTLCGDCHYYRPEGPRNELGKMVIRPEGCGLYCYLFHEYDKLADYCDGHATEAQYQEEQARKERMKKLKRNGYKTR